MPHFSKSNWLYVYKMTELLFVANNVAIVDFVNWLLNILNRIKSPSFLMSILYVIHTIFWLVLDSNFLKITDLHYQTI